MHGKQVKIKRPSTIDGMEVDEFIRRNADPIWLHQNEMWEYIEPENTHYADFQENHNNCEENDDEIPF